MKIEGGGTIKLLYKGIGGWNLFFDQKKRASRRLHNDSQSKYLGGMSEILGGFVRKSPSRLLLIHASRRESPFAFFLLFCRSLPV